MLTEELYSKIATLHQCIRRSKMSIKKSLSVSKFPRREYEKNAVEIKAIFDYLDHLDRTTEKTGDDEPAELQPASFGVDLRNAFCDMGLLPKLDGGETDSKDSPDDCPEDRPDDFIKVLKEDYDELIADSKESEQLRERVKLLTTQVACLTGAVSVAKTALTAFDSLTK